MIDSEGKNASAAYGGRFVQAYDNLQRIKHAARLEAYQKTRAQLYELFPEIKPTEKHDEKK